MSSRNLRKKIAAKRSVSESFSPEDKLREKRSNMAGQPVDTSLISSLNSVIATVKSLEEKMSEIGATVSTLDNKLSDLCANLRGELCALRVAFGERIQKAETQISSNERGIKRMQIEREIVINGIPADRQENVCEVFERICTHLGYTQMPIAAVNKYHSKKDDHNKTLKNDVTPPIFVEFSLKTDKRNFMQLYFKKSADLNLTCLDMENQSRIFVNDRLTKEDMDIKIKALQLKKDGKLHSIFVRDGCVFVKTSPASQQTAIEDLQQLHDYS
jgi:hypothetical protein